MSTTLIFSNTTQLAEFILNNNILRADVDSKHKLMEAELSEDEILLAVRSYEAEVLPDRNYLPE